MLNSQVKCLPLNDRCNMAEKVTIFEIPRKAVYVAFAKETSAFERPLGIVSKGNFLMVADLCEMA